MSSKAWIPGMVAALASCAVLADEQSVQQWFERMQRAAHTQNFEGVYVYSHNNQVNAMRIAQRVDSEGRREKIESLDGSGGEVVATKARVSCRFPYNQSVVVETGAASGVLPSFPVQIRDLSQYYEFSLQGQGRVAGRPVQRIAIRPRDEMRYGYHLWVDSHTGLLIKTEVIGPRHQTLEQMRFVEIRYMSGASDESWSPARAAHESIWRETGVGGGGASGNESAWELGVLPAGYRLETHRTQNAVEGDQSTDHLVITDGLASVSVFVEHGAAGHDDLLGGSSLGAVNAYGKVLNGYRVTAVGEAPQSAIRLISESFRLAGH
ncbi:MAG: MucB/RseB C-terminal domain-containing protein [Pseudomonadota bacterium]|nr:MAG: MucB/RseB C-terminal domain-containing protein [Pseudomonadota bacterium]